MHPQHPQPAPPAEQFAPRPVPTQLVRVQPTAWQSVPSFVRFMIWVGAIVAFVNLIAIPILVIVALVGGGIAMSGS